jgi:hypothetical protein
MRCTETQRDFLRHTVINLFPMRRRYLAILLTPLLLGGCLHVRMDPIQVHAVVDVNVKVDRALHDFFGDLDRQSTTLATPTNR